MTLIRDALNRATGPSRSSSPVLSIGTITSQHSSQLSHSSRAGSASTMSIPPEGSIPDICSTISSLARSSFHSAVRTSSYQSPSYVTGPRPRSVYDLNIMSPDQARLAIMPSRSSMTDLDEYASAAAASETGPSQTGTRTRMYCSHSGSEMSYLSQSQFDIPFLPSRGARGASQANLGRSNTVRWERWQHTRSSPGRPLHRMAIQTELIVRLLLFSIQVRTE